MYGMQHAFDRFLLWVAAAVWRDGGQRGARINAWQAMVVDSGRARARAEAEQAMVVGAPAVPAQPTVPTAMSR